MNINISFEIINIQHRARIYATQRALPCFTYILNTVYGMRPPCYYSCKMYPLRPSTCAKIYWCPLVLHNSALSSPLERVELYSLWHGDGAYIYQCCNTSIIEGHHHHHNLNCSFDVQFILIVLYYYYYHRNRIAHAGPRQIHILWPGSVEDFHDISPPLGHISQRYQQHCAHSVMCCV